MNPYRQTFIELFGAEMIVGWDATLLCGYNPQRLLPSPEWTLAVENDRMGRRWYWPSPDVRLWNHPVATPLEDIDEMMSLMRKREPTFDHKAAFISLPFDQIEQMLVDPHVRMIVLEVDTLGGDLPGRVSFDEMLADARTASGKTTTDGYDWDDFMRRDRNRTAEHQARKQPSYLAHDPTKRQKGPRKTKLQRRTR